MHRNFWHREPARRKRARSCAALAVTLYWEPFFLDNSDSAFFVPCSMTGIPISRTTCSRTRTRASRRAANYTAHIHRRNDARETHDVCVPYVCATRGRAHNQATQESACVCMCFTLPPHEMTESAKSRTAGPSAPPPTFSPPQSSYRTTSPCNK